MRLDDYPRPPGDTGIGVQWSPGKAVAVGMGIIREKWVPELKAMRVKWVIIPDHEGAEELSAHLLDNDIMPVVRLRRRPPNPGSLNVGQLEGLARHVQEGVRYFECNGEPDSRREWAGGEAPPDAPDIVIENWIKDAELILSAGGLPGTPALAAREPGDRWNWFRLLAERKRLDLLEAGAWIAIHNPWGNTPLDYPADAVNQRGQPLSAEEYEAAGGPAAFQNALSLNDLNTLRIRAANPGQTVIAGYAGFREFEYWDALANQALGRAVPVLSTGGGLVVGDAPDARYPRITPRGQAEGTAAAAAFMTSDAPETYFCACVGLLANSELGSAETEWEHAVWYGHYWDEQYGTRGVLPVVDALKQLPARPRMVRQAHHAASHREPNTLSLSKGVPPASGWRITASHNPQDTSRVVRGAASAAGGEPWCCGAAQRSSMWFSVDLGQPVPVRHVKVSSPPDTAPRSFILQLSKEGKHWQPVYAQDNNWLLVDATFEPVVARYVAITLTADSRHIPWCISAIEIE